MELLQQTPTCSDFDVVPDDSRMPAFRILLPEWIRGNVIRRTEVFHVIPGKWNRTEVGVEGRFEVGGQLEIAVAIVKRSSVIGVSLKVTNVSDVRLTDLWANICTALNHLPGSPGWSNSQFLPELELDRSLQGRYWYEKITPRRLFALTQSGWVRMHPNPEHPDANMVPLYSFVPSKDADAHACAVESPGGGCYCFQAWCTPCRWCTPCPGNACMHLEPFLADRLHPGRSVAIHGEVGIHTGDRDSLRERIETFQSSTG